MHTHHNYVQLHTEFYMYAHVGHYGEADYILYTSSFLLYYPTFPPTITCTS